jgi:hypothetical protein
MVFKLGAIIKQYGAIIAPKPQSVNRREIRRGLLCAIRKEQGWRGRKLIPKTQNHVFIHCL